MTLVKKLLTATAILGLGGIIASADLSIKSKTVSKVEKLGSSSLSESSTTSYKVTFDYGPPIFENIYKINLITGQKKPPKVGDNYLQIGSLFGPVRDPYSR